MEKIDSTADISWPPSVDELQSGERKAPEPSNTFYQTLLGFKTKTEKSVRIIESFCADILYTISLGLGIHSMTGMKTPITFLHRLGHSISYDMVCKIETAQAELAQHLLQTSTRLPLQPAYEGGKVRRFDFFSFIAKS